MLFFSCSLEAQEKNIGITYGITSFHPHGSNYSGLFSDRAWLLGLQAEYIPYKARFSISSGITYFSAYNYVMVPLGLKMFLGKKFQFNLKGALCPLYRIQATAPDKTFVLTKQIGLGFEYCFTNSYVLFTDFSGFFIPTRQYYPTHFGGVEIQKETEGLLSVSIGLKYLIRKKKA